MFTLPTYFHLDQGDPPEPHKAPWAYRPDRGGGQGLGPCPSLGHTEGAALERGPARGAPGSEAKGGGPQGGSGPGLTADKVANR